jgi:protein-S-isoprenylcysteine O-methyltransferase Ste14
LLARREERQMLERFGESYREYQRHVPMFIPRFEGGRQQEA